MNAVARNPHMSASVTIAFLGDLYLGEESPPTLAPAVAKVLAHADLVVGNQEGPITGIHEPTVEKCAIKSAPGAEKVLREWGIDVVTLANNHAFDYGWDGFEETCRLLDTAEIAHFGAGVDLDSAIRPLILTIKGIRIGLLAYSWEFVQTACATDRSFGCAPLDAELMLTQTADLAEKTDVVVVIPHWGYCEYTLPTPEHLSLADRILEANATAVIGHHSHVVQGVKTDSGALVAFSLGNFTFARYKHRGRYMKLSDENRRGAILELALQPGKVISHTMHFTRETDRVIEPDTSPRRATEHKKRSALLENDNYAKRWRRFVRYRMFKRILYWINILHWHRIRKDSLAGGWLMLKTILGRCNKG